MTIFSSRRNDRKPTLASKIQIIYCFKVDCSSDDLFSNVWSKVNIGIEMAFEGNLFGLFDDQRLYVCWDDICRCGNRILNLFCILLASMSI